MSGGTEEKRVRTVGLRAPHPPQKHSGRDLHRRQINCACYVRVWKEETPH